MNQILIGEDTINEISKQFREQLEECELASKVCEAIIGTHTAFSHVYIDHDEKHEYHTINGRTECEGTFNNTSYKLISLWIEDENGQEVGFRNRDFIIGQIQNSL